MCYGQLGYPPEKLPEIILTADGRGMCKSIQEAVDKYSDKKITLTGGWYNENVDIDGKTVRIIGSYYSKPKVNGRWKINNSICTIKNLLFHNQLYEAGNMLEINDSEFIVSGLTFNSLIEPNSIKQNPNAKESHQDLVGMYIKNSIANESIENMIFSNLTSGIISADTEVFIKQSDFSNCTGGVLCYNTIKRSLITISNCTFKQNYFGCFATRDGKLVIQHSVFQNNDFALGLGKAGMDDEGYVDNVAGKIKVINNCQIIGSRKIAIYNDGGSCTVQDSILKNNAKEYYENGKATYIKERVTEMGNSSTGPLREGMKGLFQLGMESIFKSIFSK